MPKSLTIVVALSLILVGCNQTTYNSSSELSTLPTPTLGIQQIQSDSYNATESGTINVPTTNPLPSSSNEQILNLKPTQKMYATFQTSKGNIKVELYPDKAPKTVANFVGLAEGTKSWKDPKSGQAMNNTPLYKDLIFHRVIKDFMIQGGDPLGTGTGGPGYQFEDETNSDLSFDQPGYLAMANAGPNTNGSQFFITQVPTPWLTGKHTIFGKVVEGMDIVNTIANSQTDGQDRPTPPIELSAISIERK